MKYKPYTKREVFRIQELAAEGRTNKEIAAAIGRSEESVSTRLSLYGRDQP